MPRWRSGLRSTIGECPPVPQSRDWRSPDSARGSGPRLRLSWYADRHEALVRDSANSSGGLVLGFPLTNFFAEKVDKCQITHSLVLLPE